MPDDILLKKSWQGNGKGTMKRDRVVWVLGEERRTMTMISLYIIMYFSFNSNQTAGQ
jgi:hypothetical protein